MVTVKEITNKKEWEGFLEKHPETNFLQSYQWGEFHEALGHTVIRSGFYADNKLAGVMLSAVETAKRGRYLTVPAGPIINWQDKAVVKEFKKEIVRIAKNNACSFVRVRPQIESNDFSKHLFKDIGFRSAPMHLHAELTSQLDITKSEDELMAQMRKATRYEIRKAQKIGVEIRKSTDPKDIQTFYELQLETSKRQSFIPFPYKFLHRQFEVFSKTHNAVLYSAYFEKKLLAMAFIIFYGKEAVYHYGASTVEGRSYPGAYLIQWHAILEAKSRKMTRYNFWGVAKKEGHRFANLSLFKQGFGGTDVAYLHAQDLVINYPRYAVTFIVETVRKRIRHV